MGELSTDLCMFKDFFPPLSLFFTSFCLHINLPGQIVSSLRVENSIYILTSYLTICLCYCLFKVLIDYLDRSAKWQSSSHGSNNSNDKKWWWPPFINSSCVPELHPRCITTLRAEVVWWRSERLSGLLKVAPVNIRLVYKREVCFLHSAATSATCHMSGAKVQLLSHITLVWACGYKDIWLPLEFIWKHLRWVKETE